MPRVARIKMRITDFKVEGDKGVIAVEIRKGAKYVFQRAYGIPKSKIKEFDFEQFKEQIYRDAIQLVEDKEFEDAALRRISDLMGVDIILA